MKADEFSGALEDAYLIGFLGGLMLSIWANVVLLEVWQSTFRNGVVLGFGATSLIVAVVGHHTSYLSEFKEHVEDGDGDVEKNIAEVYEDRNALAEAFAVAMFWQGYEAGWYVHDEWAVIFVELPQGQVSWHVRPDTENVPDDLPKYDDPPFDGHSRERKNDRLKQFIADAEGSCE